MPKPPKSKTQRYLDRVSKKDKHRSKQVNELPVLGRREQGQTTVRAYPEREYPEAQTYPDRRKYSVEPTSSAERLYTAGRPYPSVRAYPMNRSYPGENVKGTRVRKRGPSPKKGR